MHCPQCGMKVPEGAAACVQCGALLPVEQAQRARPIIGRTMVGVSAADVMPPAAKAPAVVPGAARTIVGMPAAVLPGSAAPAPQAPAQVPAADSAAGPVGAAGGQPPVLANAADRTMIGVAMPGIAPIDPRSDIDDAPTEPIGDTPRRRAPEEPEEDASRELGATFAWRERAPLAGKPVVGSKNPRLGRRRMDFWIKKPDHAPAAVQPRMSRRALPVIVVAGVLALGAVLFAIFWPSAPPLSARARADASGQEFVEVRCPSCPDGTELRIRDATAIVTAMAAKVALSTPLPVGENQLKVHIDRPAGGRDETVGVAVPVAYRIRPDLQTLQGERPAIQIVVEAVEGTQVSLNGKPVTLLQGRAIEVIDMSEALTGTSTEIATLSHKVPYAVTPPGGPAEQGEINVSMGIAPLHLDAPRPRVTIQAASFLLAGRTMKGAEVFAGGRPIRVAPDGSFAQSMTISAVGATQLEVRAKAAAMAPRLVRIAVRRVDSLEAAAREFITDGSITYPVLAANIKQQAGKAIVIAGEIAEARSQNNQTVILLDIPPSHGCVTKKPDARPCHVRLVQAETTPFKQGDRITAYGYVAREHPLPDGEVMAEIDVAFVLKGLR